MNVGACRRTVEALYIALRHAIVGRKWCMQMKEVIAFDLMVPIC